LSQKKDFEDQEITYKCIVIGLTVNKRLGPEKKGVRLDIKQKKRLLCRLNVMLVPGVNLQLTFPPTHMLFKYS